MAEQSKEKLIYRENPKHKKGCVGGGPPRWFPSSASLCPADLSFEEADQLLQNSLSGRDPAHPDACARYALDDQGRFFKAYSEDGGQTWHGYPVALDLVPRQVPARILRDFVAQGKLTKARYKKLLGDPS